MKYRIPIALALALFAFALTPQASAAQTCGEYCEHGVIIGCNCPVEGEHAWYDEWGVDMRMGTTSHECQYVGYHGGCAPEGPEEVQVAYREVAAAVEAGNVRTIVDLAPVIPHYVDVDQQRRLLLVRSCTKDAYVASISYANADAATAIAVVAFAESQDDLVEQRRLARIAVTNDRP